MDQDQTAALSRLKIYQTVRYCAHGESVVFLCAETPSDSDPKKKKKKRDDDPERKKKKKDKKKKKVGVESLFMLGM